MVAVWLREDDRAHVLADETSVVCGTSTAEMVTLGRFTRETHVCPDCARTIWLRRLFSEDGAA